MRIWMEVDPCILTSRLFSDAFGKNYQSTAFDSPLKFWKQGNEKKRSLVTTLSVYRCHVFTKQNILGSLFLVDIGG